MTRTIGCTNVHMKPIMERAKAAFEQAHTEIAVSTLTLPLLFTGMRSSDYWSFASRGIPAFMVTDTAPIWDTDYRPENDTPERIDSDRLAQVSIAMSAVVRDLATLLSTKEGK